MGGIVPVLGGAKAKFGRRVPLIGIAKWVCVCICVSVGMRWPSCLVNSIARGFSPILFFLGGAEAVQCTV